MEVPELHSWDCTMAEARRIQEALAGRVRIEPLPERIELVAGADLAFSRRRGLAFVSVALLRFPQMKIVEEVGLHVKCSFPYVPGLLTFREGPGLVEAFRRLSARPDVVIFDGQGYAHPRRLGLASHIGLWLGLPSVGCAKSRLIGTHEELGPAKGDSAPLYDGEEQIGTVLRSRRGVRPLFVSPGHLSDFETAEELVLRCCVKYRLPEPTRLADRAVARLKRELPG